MEGKIGIGITTHNRGSILEKSMEYWGKYALGFQFVIVDDASEIPTPHSSYRFKNNVGIAKAKNKCLSLLRDCDHIFLADDDVYPVNGNWFIPFVQSIHRHLQLSFEFNSLGQRYSPNVFIKGSDEDVNIFNAPNGCLYYFRKECIDIVGGYDERYLGYAGEHQDLSQRIHNVGLTKYPFATPIYAFADFYISDFYGIESSVPLNVRTGNISRNMAMLETNKHSKEFIPYE